ncbi:type VI secretion system-associated FHA domain protein TagH [Defluviimonas aestuarii]|uniref:type VI secretion system-associated FHA domain protein TagH n=1 Tax=Albidovulum aestuarii TaxID=1130726 RepID=UPI00249AA01A|nr:type VI secretion system-associated FHA domain protein TagH [Defluviimonas aestuarii]MDI3337735.1 type VI secretion system-associated FHA domain protein TagH [Defluviimonas aestuarii]
MTLRLVIEHSAHPQARPEMRHPGGDLSIGRGADCDWQIDDPDMFVSRRHCVVSESDGSYEVTDASRGGLFIDGADTPLGPGNSTALEPGMRLRLGDVVIRVELGEAKAETARPAAKVASRADGFDADDFFAQPAASATRAPRPETLPEPFDSGRPASAAPEVEERKRPPEFDDPFTLDPVRPADRPVEPKADAADFGFGDFFDKPAAPQAMPAPAQKPEPAAPAPQAVEADGLHAAFFRGLGLDPTEMKAVASPEEMEALGLRFRLLVDGLMHLMRARAKEKGSARVAQTTIGSADVNPLKFLATTEDALAALITPRGRGYLPPDEAITGAFRDLTDHQLRTWAALQAALRRMVDRFDPEEFEHEAEAEGLMKALLSGGRGAQLWQLYRARYREIAKAAEERFLGEVGADFRDAYEGKRRTGDD